eukprot:TRINITY_DN8090_c0_g2_i1.p1 TRINITY_DN8090_c0_g2~~TRINITY_DN8090_c0_g2_i1.p1  ORF type:complete len:252 (+),score=1.57 TRINITY_DN8090_c0_g2_i1:816-1571(+)
MLEDCGRDNVRRYYSKKKAIITVDCGGSFSSNTVMKLEAANALYPPLRQLSPMSHSGIRQLLGISFDAQIKMFEMFAARYKHSDCVLVAISEPLPIGAFILIESVSAFSFIKDPTGLDEFIVHINWLSVLGLETKQIYSGTVPIPNRLMTKRSYKFSHEFRLSVYNKYDPDSRVLLGSATKAIEFADYNILEIKYTFDSEIFTVMEPNVITINSTLHCDLPGQIRYKIYNLYNFNIECVEKKHCTKRRTYF